MSKKLIAIVTGGAGFIGSHMVDLLVEKGFSVRIIDNMCGGRLQNIAHHATNADVVLEERDILSCEASDTLFEGAKFFFHFAGIGDIVPSIDNPSQYMATNALGTVKMLECARSVNVEKFVYAASSSCYGLAQVPTSESHPIDIRYPYALSKYQGEQAALHWHQVYGLPVNVIRIFNAYGLRSRTSGAYGAVFGVFLRQIIANMPLTVVGDGSQTRDFLYVSDVVKAFYAAADTMQVGRVYNLGAGKPKSVNHLVSLLGAKEVTYIPKRPGEPECTWADISLISSELKWRPEVDFEEGVGIMLDNINYWENAPLWGRDSIDKATETWFRYMGKETKNELS